MVVTQLEGKVGPGQWETLRQAYHEGVQHPLPAYIYQTYLVQDEADRDTWRILTVWQSRQALQDYRASVETPAGVLMFRAAGVEPVLSIYGVVDRL